MNTLTEQQQAVLQAVEDSEYGEIIGVSACAGSGKSATLLAVVDHIKPKKAFYSAYNKAIVSEASEKFTSNVTVKTFHAFAYMFAKPSKGIEDFTYLCIKEKLSYTSKFKIINAMRAFFISASADMHEFLFDLLEDEHLTSMTIKYIEQMLNDEIPGTFDFMLKYLHLSLLQGHLTIKYDMMCIDECQDVSAVSLEIFKLIDARYKILVGDPMQNIYSEFTHTVNAFDVIEDMKVLTLTKSFRCSEPISQAIEKFGRKYLSKSFEFKGIETPQEDGLTAYITATNAQIVYRLSQLHEEGQGYVLTRPIKDIFACPLALSNAAGGREVYHKRYKFLEKEYKRYTTSGSKSFFSYLKQNVQDEEIHNSIDLLMRFKKNKLNIFEVLKDAKASKKDKSVLVSTGFSCKGLGFSTVYIEDDLNRSVAKIIERGGPTSNEDYTTMKVYYVAVSRCRKYLRNAKHLKDL